MSKELVVHEIQKKKDFEECVFLIRKAIYDDLREIFPEKYLENLKPKKDTK